MTSAPDIRFGTDGWRAVIADEFTVANVRGCTYAVAEYLRQHGSTDSGAVVGYDTRFGSQRFAEVVAAALTARGVAPVTLADRPVPTPALSLAVAERQRGIGVMITASHNPPEWNGFKVKSPRGGSASPEEVAQIEAHLPRALADARDETAQSEGDEGYDSADITEPYVAAITRLVDIAAIRDASFRVAVDSMHGSGAGAIVAAVAGGSTTVDEMRADVNPDFPGMQQPEPIGENLSQLSEMVAAGNYAVGLATDGDADRLGVIDEHGRYMTTLEVFSLLFHHLKARRRAPGGAASTITMSAMVDRLAAHHGTQSVRTPIGFKFVGPAMIDGGCVIGGEESGGYAFAGHIPERDGPLSGLILLEAMAQSGNTPSELLAEVHEITGPWTFRRIDSQFAPPERQRIAEALATDVAPQTFGDDAVDVDRTDGVRVRFADDSWGVARLSGTEPLVRIYAEAPSTPKREAILAALVAHLRLDVGD